MALGLPNMAEPCRTEVPVTLQPPEQIFSLAAAAIHSKIPHPMKTEAETLVEQAVSLPVVSLSRCPDPYAQPF